MMIEKELDNLRKMEDELRNLEKEGSELKRQHIIMANNFRKKYKISFEEFVEMYYI